MDLIVFLMAGVALLMLHNIDHNVARIVLALENRKDRL